MPEQPVNDEQAEIKKRAMQRMVVAASLITAAVVTLTVLNHKKPEPPQPAATATAPAEEQAEPVRPEILAKEAPEEELPVEPPASAEQTPPIPDSEAAPTTPPAPPPPRVINKVEPPTALQAKPRAETPAPTFTLKQPGIESPTPAKPPATPVVKSIAPPQVAPATAPVVAPVLVQKPAAAATKTLAEAPPQPAKAVAEPIPAKGYVVQLGLFTNPDNALQLQKRLAEHGIKSYTETRLQVGPFQTKAEADQAQAKIRNLGINAVLAPLR